MKSSGSSHERHALAFVDRADRARRVRLCDVHRPGTPNGAGVISIVSGGWQDQEARAIVAVTPDRQARAGRVTVPGEVGPGPR